ncbi:hypothetical protein ABIA39_008862 [Nocardia sp. GAS34]|uniref:aKG-HExxH-type peptide beta-hydroxylase n=1 Tax=unclassified Nocardia TaxID=2637762 RepID=UPI003D201133
MNPNELDTVFDFPPIHTLHRTRTHTIHSTLGSPAAGARLDRPAMTYALAHHILEGAEHAARTGDGERFSWYRSAITQPPPGWAEDTAHGEVIVQNPDRASMHSSSISDAPYYLLGPQTRLAARDLVELTIQARAIAADCGFGVLLANHAPVVCLLDAKAAEDTLNSWTITRLPGTVFLDYTPDPYILARDLIHEAGHNWLNDALTATRSMISDDVNFYSPWKKTPRPAFGFLHACWAFPLTVLFAARTLATAPESTGQILSAYTSQQHENLNAVTGNHRQALRLIADLDLRQRLGAVRAAASAISTGERETICAVTE